MDHTWIIIDGSHNTPKLVGYVLSKHILIRDQIHVSVRGKSAPFWGGIGTMPVMCFCEVLAESETDTVLSVLSHSSQHRMA